VCHLGSDTCFGARAPAPAHPLDALETRIVLRAKASPEESYTAQLVSEGVKRVAQKVGEEGVEAALAGAAGDADELCEEAADLLYHLTVLLHARQLSLRDVYAVLDRRAEGPK
jgi:phosphoribosyl-ATP pyrophosphohydrolase/phosphoribosyl-AMP cyclohydrolase